MKIQLFEHLDPAETFGCWDFKAALVIGIAATLLLVIWPPTPQGTPLTSLISIYMTIAAGLLSLIIAAYAIFVGLTDPEFLVFLRREDNALSSYVGAFSVTAYAAIFAVVSGAVELALFTSRLTWSWPVQVKFGCQGLVLTLLLWAVLASAELVKTISDYIVARADYYSLPDHVRRGEGRQLEPIGSGTSRK